MSTIKYLRKETANLYKNGKVATELLWGDRIEVLSGTPVNGQYNVNARGYHNAYINTDDVGDEALLELYFIDVGQGDGILIVTPDRKHVVIDGGYTRTKTGHGKSAADFIDWKFKKDYGMDKIEIDAMICSHCDADHYGGLWDLIDEKKKKHLDTKETIIKKFYHAGVSWWKSNGKSKYLGNEDGGVLHDLLDDRASIKAGLSNNNGKTLQGEWAKFLDCLYKTKAKCKRLSHNPEKGFTYLPDFGEDDTVSFKILGPVEKIVDGKPTLKDLGGNSKNTNGNSILLRLDYGKARILLTGDLNKKSQQYLLKELSGHRQEFAADVAKSCHHGSDDCSFEFMQIVQAAATIISSGDDEKHAHPRPNIVATAGSTGYKKVVKDEMLTPLIYSTEISRSVKLADPYEVNCKDFNSSLGILDVCLNDEKVTKISYLYGGAGALNQKRKTKSMSSIKVVDGIVYGLVNVRTDGNKILCATLNEGKKEWDVKTFESRF